MMDKHTVRPMTRSEHELFGPIFEEPAELPFLAELAHKICGALLILAIIGTSGALVWMAVTDIVRQAGG
jgi:hypothetical protein